MNLPGLSRLLRSALPAAIWAGTIVSLRAEDPARPMWWSPGWGRVVQEEQALREELATLPPAPVPHLTERLGYHSGYSASPNSVEWLEMALPREEPVDAVVLIAAPSNSGGSASAGYGFPVRFRVELGAAGGEREVIADFTGEDFPNPGALPVFLRAHGHLTRSVRITATRLASEDHRYLFALGEVMILRGWQNLASRLARSSFTYSRTTGALPVWGLSNLVDRHTVLGPPIGLPASATLGYRSKFVNIAKEPEPSPRWVQVDLGAELPIEEVRAFPAHPPEFAHRPGYGFPASVKVEMSNDPEFREATELHGFLDGGQTEAHEMVNPGDNVVSFFGDGKSARYVRFTALRLFNSNGQFNFALGELQVWSGGKNVALDRPVAAYDSLEGKGWSEAALVDGFTSEAKIVDEPAWLQGLSRRREILEQLARLDLRRAAIVNRDRTVGWWLLAGLIAVAAGILGLSVLRQRRNRQSELEALRQRISRDLHDEIGSSLGSIALISQDALAVADDPEQVRRELTEIQNLASQTVDSMRDIVRLVQAENYGEGELTAHFQEIAARMLRSIPHTLHAEAGAAFNRIPMNQRRDLVLMFKETLHNILRHAEASKVEIGLAESEGKLALTVRDNGCGFAPGSNGGGLGLLNLRRRAEKLGGSLQIESAPGCGTTLAITLPLHAR